MKTYSTAEVADMLCGNSMKEPERWVIRQITRGRFTARKVGRQWRLTDADVAHALDVLANKAAPELDCSMLSAASQRRRMAVAQ